MSDPVFDSPCLQGAAAPISDELDHRHLEVTGEIPAAPSHDFLGGVLAVSGGGRRGGRG